MFAKLLPSHPAPVTMETALTAPNRFFPLDVTETALVADLSDDPYPTAVYTVADICLDLPGGVTYFGMVLEGQPTLLKDGHGVILLPGQFFVLEGPLKLEGSYTRRASYGSAGKLLLIAVPDYKGYRVIGGPVEADGRLPYIDGCRDTVLVSPPVYGEPCLNHLHVPHSIHQTEHTHPSQRIGVILRGSGYVLTPYEPGLILRPDQTVIPTVVGTKGENVWRVKTPLKAGMGWWIPTGLLHSFHTGPHETMDVLAWHPESTFGPTRDDHPMIERTLVNGVPATRIEAIRTKE